jgi:HSP20 family molecular chaperone IbpA
MANEKTHEVQTVQSDSGTAVEQTRPGPVYIPAVDIFEQDSNITLLADMPGVRAGDLKIDLHENVLTMTGDVDDPESDEESAIFREYQSGRFYRQFTLSDKIDQDKIEASLTDGVLRLVLPKAEASKPREIAIKAK